MKTLIAFAILAISTSSYAYFSYFDQVDEDHCKGLIELKNKNVALCTKVPGYREIYNASKSTAKNIQKLPEFVEFKDVIELSIWPDDSTSMIYFYPSILKDAEGKKIGYRVYHAYHNSEMESLIKLESRFSLEGKLVSITIDN